MFNKICLFGDSISKGVVYNREKNRYTTLKDGFVRKLASLTGVDIKNFSMFGCTVNKGEEIIKRHEADIKDCDVVVLEFGGNDSDHSWESISENPEISHHANTDITIFRKTYENIISGLTAMGKKVVMFSLPPIDANKYFKWISNGRNAENIKSWLGGSVDYIYRWHEMYNNVVCDIANSMKIKLIDLRSIFLEKKNYSDYICDDGIHPNEKGHELLLEAVEKELCLI